MMKYVESFMFFLTTNNEKKPSCTYVQDGHFVTFFSFLKEFLFFIQKSRTIAKEDVL